MQHWQLWTGSGRLDGDRGGGDGGGGARRGWWGLVVRIKSKSYFVLLLLVLFITYSNLFCTAWEFAPARRVPRVPGEGWLEGSQAAGLEGRYPHLDFYGWDDKGF